MPSSHLILCCPLILLSSTFPILGVFSNESALYFRGPKYWSFNFSILPLNTQGWFPLGWLVQLFRNYLELILLISINYSEINIYVRNKCFPKKMLNVTHFKLLDDYCWIRTTYFGSLWLVLPHFVTSRGTWLKLCLEMSFQKSIADSHRNQFLDSSLLTGLHLPPKYKIKCIPKHNVSSVLLCFNFRHLKVYKLSNWNHWLLTD